MLVVATKSFQTDFKFTSKTAGALANALQQSKRVDVQMTQRIRSYARADLDKTTKFDSFFEKKEFNVEKSVRNAHRMIEMYRKAMDYLNDK